ncbi:MAG TPA: pyridoxal-phosphate dependent enzyme [Kribbella sp.]|nr:pyridoxal-phosphate dependent enzyme [Kribbella sp.]
MPDPHDPLEPRPRVSLGTWPTPLEPAPRLAAALDLRPEDLWIKRDDLSSLGSGGNKARKLEWTLGAALAAGADTVITIGAPQSNHARLTAAAAARLGLTAILVFPGGPGDSHSGNIALDGLFGARVAWAGDADRAVLSRLAEDIASQLRADGLRPALIPFGGSSATGALGYVESARELLDQAPDFDLAVVALGSGGTMAGLVAELGPSRVLGIHTGAIDEPQRVVADFAGQVSGTAVAADQLHVRLDQVGGGYGEFTEPTADALSLVARTEGIVLDPIYTGRAMAGLIAAVKDGSIRPGQKTVFFHTGGLPGFFGNDNAVRRAEAQLAVYPLPE